MIAIVYPQFYGVGGIARYLDSFLTNLPPHHPSIYLITTDEHYSKRNYPGVEMIHLSFATNRLHLFIGALKVRKLLNHLYDEGLIQWINFHCPPLIPGLFLPRRIPMALTAHTTYLGMSGRFYNAQHFKSPWGVFSLTIKMWMEQRIFSQAQKVITLTEQGKQEISAYGYNGEVHVIPNGVDINMFSPDADVAKDFDVIFTGRIELRKGSRSMVELCRNLVVKSPGIKICIVGYGDDEEYVRQALSELEQVTLTGKVSFQNMISYYNRSRVYVSPSYYEGLPGTCLEAMAMQLPVVVWDFLFYRDLVIDGETGWLVEPNDIGSMTTKVFELLSDELTAGRMGIQARNHLINQYNWSNLSSELLDVIQDKGAKRLNSIL